MSSVRRSRGSARAGAVSPDGAHAGELMVTLGTHRNAQRPHTTSSHQNHMGLQRRAVSRAGTTRQSTLVVLQNHKKLQNHTHKMEKIRFYETASVKTGSHKK